MATIKSFTDLQQSKKLAEILPLESADMTYICIDICKGLKYMSEPRFIKNIPNHADEYDVAAWSLAALLNILPEIQGSKPVIALDDNYITYPHMSDLHTKADNLVDACVAMIEKIHVLNLL